MKIDEEEIRRIFAQVRGELYFPPCELEVLKDENETPFFISNFKVYISPSAIPKEMDWKKYLQSVIRHELSHLHYCPYDIKTAYELVKEAYGMCKNWDIAYSSLLLFSDLNVDCFYLLNRFNETPYHLKPFLNSSQKGFKKYVQAAYRSILEEDHKKYDYRVENVAKQIRMVVRSEISWFSKIRLIAVILSRNNVKPVTPKNLAKFGAGIPLREDLNKNNVKKISEILGGVREREEARKFYEYWIKPRLKGSELDEIKKTIKKIRDGGGEEKAREGDSGRLKSGAQAGAGREPVLPTSISKPYSKLSEKMVEDLLWKVFWYRARAERTMLIYLEEGRKPEPNLSIFKYPTDWNIEDEVEDLDLESSSEEGKLRVEINTVKLESEIRGKGSSLTISNVPSSLTVLDASRSMEKVFDNAAISAFINLLSAERVGSKTASITFSTNHYSIDWQGSTFEKELALSLYFGEMTVLPLNKILKLVKESENMVLINIITDCGWQNIEEALPLLKQITDKGNKVKIFYLHGGEYPENVRKISRIKEVKAIPVRDPERDLQYLVTKEVAEGYGGVALTLK
ncbi:MAG: hypothetical protein ACUVQ0_01615 [Thermoproteota archaeon]